jgi:hypothetical protein
MSSLKQLSYTFLSFLKRVRPVTITENALFSLTNLICLWIVTETTRVRFQETRSQSSLPRKCREREKDGEFRLGLTNEKNASSKDPDPSACPTLTRNFNTSFLWLVRKACYKCPQSLISFKPPTPLSLKLYKDNLNEAKLEKRASLIKSFILLEYYLSN